MTHDAARYGHLFELYGRARQLDRVDREAFLAVVAAQQRSLHVELEALLRADAECGDGSDPLDDDFLAAMRRHADQPASGLGNTVSTSSRPGRIGQYRILATLGVGGMGIVYRAEQRSPRREVALKVVQPGVVQKHTLARFVREAEVLGQLEHAGIARIYDSGSCDLGYGEMPYFAMELVRGAPLREYAEANGLDTAAKCRLVARVCDAVQHAHERGIVHRDLKPSNILCADGYTDEDGPQPKVLDFGIARTTDASAALSTLQTGTGQLLGTLPYMSPEQLGGSRHVDARSDVYSLGVILYELLGRQLPLDLAGLPLTDVGRIVNDVEPTQLGRIDRELRGDLETIAGRALAKEPERRYGSAAELASDLRRFLRSEPIHARPQTTWYQIRKFTRRNRVVVGATATIMAGLCLALVIVARYARDEAAAKLEMRDLLYGSQMRAAGSELSMRAGTANVRSLVEGWRAPEDPDPRGWEWCYLWAASHRETRIESGRLPESLLWGPRGIIEKSAPVVRRLDPSTLAARAMICRYPGRYHPVAAFSGDGRRVVQTSSDTALTVYDTESGAAVREFDFGSWPAQPAMNADGSRIGCMIGLYEYRVFDVASGQPVCTVSAGRVLDSAFSPDGRYLALAMPEEITIWDPRTGESEGRIGEGIEFAIDVEWSPDSRQLALGDRGGNVRVWDAPDWQPKRCFHHTGWVLCVRWNPDGVRLASSSQNCELRVSDVARGDSAVLPGHSSAVSALAWNPDGHRLLSGGADGTLRVWDTRRASPMLRRKLPAQAERCRDLSWGEDGESVVLDSGAFVWHPESGELEREAAVWTPAAPDSTLEVRVVDGVLHAARTGDSWSLAREGLPTQVFSGVRVDATRMRAVVSCWKATWLWDLEHDELRKLSDGAAQALALHPDGTRVALADPRATRILSLPDGAEVAASEVPIGGPNDVDWSPDGRRLASACHDNVIRVWDPATGEVDVLRGHSAVCFAVRFSPDGTRIASGSRDRTLRIWDVARRREVLSVEFENEVVRVAWSPDGRQLALFDDQQWLTVLDARSGFTELRSQR